MLVAWTTVGRREDADNLATAIIARGLAACVQVDGPVVSHYRWHGHLERAEEFRLALKFTPDRLTALEGYVLAHHPYETPEWLVVRAERVGEKYLSWAEANSTNPPL